MADQADLRHDPRSEVPLLGLRNFWYPATRSSAIRKNPIKIKLLGEEVALFRDAGKVYAMHDRCPHRGLALSEGKRFFPGTITCFYHGWTFDTKGDCVATLTSGPNIPLPADAKVKTYAVEEHNGIAWIFMGEDPPRPIEDDVPPELLTDKNIIYSQVEEWNCNWMPALENLMDTHDVLVHRTSLFYLLRKLPCWIGVSAIDLPDGRGIDFKLVKMGPLQDEYPKVGKWPRSLWWRRFKLDSPKDGDYPTSQLRMPGLVRIGLARLMTVRYAIPVDEHRMRAFLFSSRHAPGLQQITYRLYYHLWASWSLLKYFIGQDKTLFEKLDYGAPERLVAADIGVVKWRRMVTAWAKRETKIRSAIWADANVPVIAPKGHSEVKRVVEVH